MQIIRCGECIAAGFQAEGILPAHPEVQRVVVVLVKVPESAFELPTTVRALKTQIGLVSF